MKCYILILLITYSINLTEPALSQSQSYSLSSSYSATYQDDGSGNPQKNVQSVLTEEHRDKLNDNPEEVRKYGELFVGQDTPKTNTAILKQKASTNVKPEAKLLGNGEKISHPEGTQREVNKF
jgi:hypothetical protein